MNITDLDAAASYLFRYILLFDEYLCCFTFYFYFLRFYLFNIQHWLYFVETINRAEPVSCTVCIPCLKCCAVVLFVSYMVQAQQCRVLYILLSLVLCHLFEMSHKVELPCFAFSHLHFWHFVGCLHYELSSIHFYFFLLALVFQDSFPFRQWSCLTILPAPFVFLNFWFPMKSLKLYPFPSNCASSHDHNIVTYSSYCRKLTA